MKDPRKLWEILIGLDEPFVIATVCNTKTSSERMEGEVFGMTYAGKFYGEAEGEFRRFLEANMTKAMKTSMSFMETYIEHRSVAAQWGATCGERTSVFFHYVGPSPKVYIFGAGKLSERVAKILVAADFDVMVMDDNENFLRNFDKICSYRKINYNEPGSFPTIEARDFCVVLTRGHTKDFEALQICLASKARYIGLIGSNKKNSELKERMFRAGYTEEAWERVKTPIGIEIGAQTPGEIAIAIAAEIVKVKNEKQ
ncbi:XdhC family protein [Kosmotoga sp.]|uniref:XdhC family protein n=1 Tax=Kosmotoga sp. TaxID=1955248 RepID=UPI0024AB69EB|nr:XdhC family protein [Kosmotoga sp.]MDI3524246.1 xanthine dehydrogenase accessory factor [Kosmotoga sp.]